MPKVKGQPCFVADLSFHHDFPPVIPAGSKLILDGGARPGGGIGATAVETPLWESLGVGSHIGQALLFPTAESRVHVGHVGVTHRF